MALILSLSILSVISIILLLSSGADAYHYNLLFSFGADADPYNLHQLPQTASGESPFSILYDYVVEIGVQQLVSTVYPARLISKLDSVEAEALCRPHPWNPCR